MQDVRQMCCSKYHQHFIDLLSVKPAANKGVWFSVRLLMEKKQMLYSVHTGTASFGCLSDGACALFCRCGVPPFDEQVTQNEFRLSLIHPAQWIPDYYVTKIIY